MDPKDLGIEFENQLSYTEEFNPYTYRNFYNGAGVAMGDINNDGLIDLYFTGNMTENKLYLNKGDWKFEDITDRAGVACSGVWSAGATWADINGDGLLDLYVTKSGMPGGQNRNNELFINQGDLTFKESSAAYGLDVVGLSVQAAFFDYDADGVSDFVFFAGKGYMELHLSSNTTDNPSTHLFVEPAKDLPVHATLNSAQQITPDPSPASPVITPGSTSAVIVSSNPSTLFLKPSADTTIFKNMPTNSDAD